MAAADIDKFQVIVTEADVTTGELKVNECQIKH